MSSFFHEVKPRSPFFDEPEKKRSPFFENEVDEQVKNSPEHTESFRSPFFDSTSEYDQGPVQSHNLDRDSQPEGFLDSLGKAFAYQIRSGGPAGAASLNPEQAKRVAIEVGTQAAVSGVFAPLRGLAAASKYAPRALSFITGLGEAAATGAAVPVAESLANDEELPSKEELLKNGAVWAGIDLVLNALHLGSSFGRTVNQLSKETGLKRYQVVNRIWNGAKNYYGWTKPRIDPETGAAIIMPEQIEQMVQLAEREPEIIAGHAERIQPKTREANLPVEVAVKPELTETQIQNRKIHQNFVKQAEERTSKAVEQNKEQAEKTRKVAFKAIGIPNGESNETAKAVKSVIPDNPDTETMVALEQEELTGPSLLRAQAIAEMQYMRDEVSRKLAGIWGKVNVETPFIHVDAPETGRAVKLFYDTKNAYLEEARGVVNKINKLELTPEERWDTVLAYESGQKQDLERLTKAQKIFGDYFTKSFKDYKEAGGLQQPFPQSLISRLEQRIVDLKSKVSGANISKQAQGKTSKEISEIREEIKTLKTLKYFPKSASLITQALAEAFSDIDPKFISKFAIAAHKKRTTGALADWIKSDPRIKDVLDPFDFIADYAQKKGNDLALLRIIKAAKKEGLATKGEKIGFKMDPIRFPALAGYNVHPALFEYITNLANPLPYNTYDKIGRWAKASIVFDPTYVVGTILPYLRTLVQSPQTLAKLPKYWQKALHDYINHTPDYVEFIENGGASTPFPETRDFQNFIERAKLDNSSPLKLIANSLLTKEGLMALGNDIQNLTWNLERLCRMSYYNMLKDKGFDVSDAAKLSAENFLDYNKLPAKTRRILGRIFFAPIYQLLSIMNDTMLVMSPLKMGYDYANNPNNFKNNKINKERVSLLIGSAIILFGLDQLYQHMGFEREDFGTRYVADYLDENGKEREVVITPSQQINASLRWANSFASGFKPGEVSPIQKITGRLMGQLGPLPALIKELVTNKGSDNKPIWDNVGDSLPTVMQKVFLHTVNKMLPFAVTKFYTPEEKQAAREKVKEAFGTLDYFMDSIQFIYDRNPKNVRQNAKIKILRSRMAKLRREGNLTDDAEERYNKAISDLQSDQN